VELFRFPTDRLEQTNLRDRQPDEVRQLKGIIEAWKSGLPTEPNENCFSAER
jgi:hypothetical protein